MSMSPILIYTFTPFDDVQDILKIGKAPAASSCPTKGCDCLSKGRYDETFAGEDAAAYTRLCVKEGVSF